jgi:hypothetical protein
MLSLPISVARAGDICRASADSVHDTAMDKTLTSREIDDMDGTDDISGAADCKSKERLNLSF